MTKEELDRYIAYKAKVCQEVLEWLVADIAYFKFHNSTNYNNALTQIKNRTVIGGRKIGNYHLKKMTSLFNIDKWFITFLCGGQHFVTREDESGKLESKRERIARAVLKKVKATSRFIKYIGKKDCKTKSGKKFSHLGWWKLTDEGIAKTFETEELLDKNSYCEESKFIISKIAFHYAKMKTTNLERNNKEENMTKAEKEKLKKECDEGKHGLAYEYLVKQIEKKEKQNLKTLQTRIMKFTQQAMSKIVEENKNLKAENESLKAENKYLRERNTDIPVSADIPVSEEKEEKKLTFDEYCDLINAADDPGTFTYNIPEERLSEDCKKQCIEGSLLDDDIPEEDDEDDADKLEAIKHSLTELENQKKNSAVRPPEDDIPEEAPPEDDIPAAPEEKHYSKVIPRLQEFVNKCYISKREAERFAAIAKEKIPIKESRTGFSSQDRQKNKSARETIIQVFVSEYKDMMDDKDWKWAKEFMS